MIHFFEHLLVNAKGFRYRGHIKTEGFEKFDEIDLFAYKTQFRISSSYRHNVMGLANFSLRFLTGKRIMKTRTGAITLWPRACINEGMLTQILVKEPPVTLLVQALSFFGRIHA